MHAESDSYTSSCRSAALPYPKHGHRRMPAPMRSPCNLIKNIHKESSMVGTTPTQHIFQHNMGNTQSVTGVFCQVANPIKHPIRSKYSCTSFRSVKSMPRLGKFVSNKVFGYATGCALVVMVFFAFDVHSYVESPAGRGRR